MPKMRLIPLLLLALSTSLPALTKLRAEGNSLKNQNNETIVLRGCNLGSWLIFEPWMSPMDCSGIKDDYTAREVLEKRFGFDKAEALIDIYQEHYVTTEDLDNIKAAGLNCIRLPFWYGNLQTEDGKWLKDGFKRIDWCVTEAGKRGIYTILDLHGAPGGQSPGESTGRIRKPEHNGMQADFWTNEKQLIRTIEIWQKVVSRYKGRPEVAAYDVLNEPFGAPSRTKLIEVYDRLYKSIREIDPQTIISFETCWSGKENNTNYGWGWNVLPDPQEHAWKQVLYQLHNYEWDWKSEEKQISSTDRQIKDLLEHRKWQVPALMGEFNCMGHEPAWKHTIAQFEKHQMSWTMWNYKATHGSGDDSWGFYNMRNPAPPKPDLQKDSAEDIAKKWKAWSTKNAFTANPMLHRVFQQTIPQP